MNEFENRDRRMPYRPGDFDALTRRIRRATVERPAAETAAAGLRRPTGRGRRILLAAGPAVAAAALVALGIFAFVRPDEAPSLPDFEELLATASPEVIAASAAENYDDILYIQQL